MVYKIEFISATSALELSAQIRANWVKCDEVIDSNELVIEATDLQVYLAARVKEKQVGLLNLKFPYSANAHIGWLGVLPDYQGQGARTSLIHAAYVYAKQQRVQTMTVAVVTPDKENNDYLKRYQFYEKHGFQPLLNGSSEAGMVYMLKPLSNPLYDLVALEKNARWFGFDWPNQAMIIEQIISECDEIKEALELQEPKERIQEEIGDLLHSVLSLCLFTGFEPEQTLLKTVEKFSARMRALKAVTRERGLVTLKGQPIELLLMLWAEAKTRTKAC
ncbi:GNAT family N-acetyltransferase [Legionella sp. 29fVS95]|uniref:GNAT family N-acetyltransferase n=1 Tax=Legionella sp. 29fVS95 TaxID=3402813 RepID=UPI003AF6A6C0